jgi:hypothetical protein
MATEWSPCPPKRRAVDELVPVGRRGGCDARAHTMTTVSYQPIYEWINGMGVVTYSPA